MSNSTFFAIVGVLVVLGPLLDNIATEVFRRRVSELLLSANRRSFTVYVAGSSLRVYELVFDRNAFSWKFFWRSALFTAFFVFLGLIFLWGYFPQTYYAAISSFLTAILIPTNWWFILPPILIILIFDYLCNAQTKFFLSLMEASPSLKRFLVIGYADLVVTASISIIGLSLAYFTYLYSAYQIPVNDVRISFDFKDSIYFSDIKADSKEDKKEDKNEAVLALISSIERSDIDKTLNHSDDELIKSYPAIGTTHLAKVKHREGHRVVQFFNSRGTIEAFLSDAAIVSETLAHANLDSKDIRQRCEYFSQIIPDAHSHVKIIAGWDSQNILEHCLAGTRVNLLLTIKPQDANFRYAYASTDFAGELISLSLKSFVDKFRFYQHGSIVNPFINGAYWNWHYVIGDNQPFQSVVDHQLRKAWSYRQGSHRVYQINNYPWSTFYVASLLTSVSIWLVLLFTAILFPIVWFTEAIVAQPTLMKIRRFPFSVICLIASFLVLVVHLLN